MEYKVVVAGYSTELKNLKAGWLRRANKSDKPVE